MDAFLGEIRIFGFIFTPKGWARCDGQTLPINQNQALFSLLGTTYGGNGQTTFQLPNLQGRTVFNAGAGYDLGTVVGEELHVLTTDEIPLHNHSVSAWDAIADTAQNVIPPGPTVAFAQAYAVPQGGGQIAVNRYSTDQPNNTLDASALGLTGSNQGHENRQPFLTLQFCMSLQGIFPSRP